MYCAIVGLCVSKDSSVYHSICVLNISLLHIYAVEVSRVELYFERGIRIFMDTGIELPMTTVKVLLCSSLRRRAQLSFCSRFYAAAIPYIRSICGCDRGFQGATPLLCIG